MSDFTNLISAELKQIHIDMITEVLRGCSVTCSILFGDTTFTDCPNCVFDPILNRSSNVYETSPAGPVPFSMGNCPYCHGQGKINNEQTSTLSLCPIYDYRKWIPIVSSNVQSPESFVQTLSVFSTTYNTLVRAKEIIIDTSIDSTVRPRFVRHGEPEPCGMGSSSFIATMWERIERG